MVDDAKRLDVRGFEIIQNAFDGEIVENLTRELSRLSFGKAAKKRKEVAFGVRNLLNTAPKWVPALWA